MESLTVVEERLQEFVTDMTAAIERTLRDSSFNIYQPCLVLHRRSDSHDNRITLSTVERGDWKVFYAPEFCEVSPDMVFHMLCVQLYKAGFVAADKQYQDYNSDSMLLVMPANKQSDEDPAPPNTLRSCAMNWFERARKALDAEAGKSSSCIYLMRYHHGSNRQYQERLIAIANGSIVYECDIKDSVYYTGAEIANAIKAMVLDSDNMRIQKADPHSRRLVVPPSSIHRLYLIDWLR